MARYEVKVEARDGESVLSTFVVNTGNVDDSFRYGTTAEQIAGVVAGEFCDSGSVIVRRLGGGERVVVGRA